MYVCSRQSSDSYCTLCIAGYPSNGGQVCSKQGLTALSNFVCLNEITNLSSFRVQFTSENPTEVTMAKKLKTYGKKKGQDLVSAFGKLALSLPSSRSPSSERPVLKYSRKDGFTDGALSPTSGNDVRKFGKPTDKLPSGEALFLQENRPILDDYRDSQKNPVSVIQADEKLEARIQPEQSVLVKQSDAPLPIGFRNEQRAREAAPRVEEAIEISLPAQAKDVPSSHPQLKTIVPKIIVSTRKTLRSTRQGRTSPEDPVPNPHLSLDLQTLEHLRPLTKLEGVACTRDIQLWHAEWTSFCDIVKIAEGTYGSVFRLSDRSGSHRATIGKLMPLRAKSGVGSKKATNTSVADAASEIKLLELMNDVPGFVVFRGAEVLIGSLPKALRTEYAAFQKREMSRNDAEYFSIAETSFPRHQAWLFIEMDNAGMELDRAFHQTDESGLLQFSKSGDRYLPVHRTRDIFWGTVEALARGEEMHNFEHRDLHLSNICIDLHDGDNGANDQDSPRDDYGLVPTTINLSVTIIDYTLSRATLPNRSAIFNSMRDPGIFQGDGAADLQFDIYRHMRDLVFHLPFSSQERRNATRSWKDYVPITNVLWLSFLLTKLMAWTPRPRPAKKGGGEDGLWISLNELKRELDVEHRWMYRVRSAGDVVRWMELGREEYLKEIEEEGGI